MAVELVLVRPPRSVKSRFEFVVHTKENFKPAGYKKLGRHSPDGRAEEWCHKDDYDFYRAQREE